jgi:hypothetical protein
MENNEFYEKKYLKYKEKYNLLKSQKNLKNSQTGGIMYLPGDYIFFYPLEKQNNINNLIDNNKLLSLDKFTNLIGSESYYYKKNNDSIKRNTPNINITNNITYKQVKTYLYIIKENIKGIDRIDPDRTIISDNILKSLREYNIDDKIKDNDALKVSENIKNLNLLGLSDDNFKKHVKEMIEQIQKIQKQQIPEQQIQEQQTSKEYNAILIQHTALYRMNILKYITYDEIIKSESSE